MLAFSIHKSFAKEVMYHDHYRSKNLNIDFQELVEKLTLKQ